MSDRRAFLRLQYSKPVLPIALGLGFSDLASFLWWPFMPFYLLELGAEDEAEAMSWMTLALVCLGGARLVASPIWGFLSDRFGRKTMLMRSLICLIFSSTLFGFATAPWQIVVILIAHGFLAGYDGPAVALLSVSVPENELKKSLALTTSAKFIGQTLGPAIGAALAIVIGYRGALFSATFIAIVVAICVALFAPNDKKVRIDPTRPLIAPGESYRPSRQLWFIIFIYTMLMAVSQLIRLILPFALKHMGEGNATQLAGIGFSVGGFASAFGVLFLSARMFRVGRFRQSLGIGFVAVALSYAILMFCKAPAYYIATFGLLSLLQAVLVPPTNTLIALNTPAARRGTAFGLAAGGQAVATVIGPAGATFIAATSYAAGYGMVAIICAVLGGLVFLRLREPSIVPEAA